MGKGDFKLGRQGVLADLQGDLPQPIGGPFDFGGYFFQSFCGSCQCNGLLDFPQEIHENPAFRHS